MVDLWHGHGEWLAMGTAGGNPVLVVKGRVAGEPDDGLVWSLSLRDDIERGCVGNVVAGSFVVKSESIYLFSHIVHSMLGGHFGAVEGWYLCTGCWGIHDTLL